MRTGRAPSSRVRATGCAWPASTPTSRTSTTGATGSRRPSRCTSARAAALREVGTPNDVAVALRNMAVCHISLNDFAQALAVHREARAFCEAHGLARLVVEADYNIAYLHYLRGEYTLALELYQAARGRAEALGDGYHRALCDLDQSELYLELNLLEEGIALAEQALAGFESLGMRYETAKALTNLAVGVGRRGEALRSLQLFARAREMFVARRK